MSFQGGVDYFPVTTVDEVADNTQMQGNNSGNHNSSSWNTPTKQLLLLWFAAVAAYVTLGWFFRRYTTS